MKRIERKQLESIKKEVATGRETWKIRPYIQGLGIQIQDDGYAWIGNISIDLRFDNLQPEIKTWK